LRERDLELVQTHVRDVCDAALATDEVVAEFLAAVIEGREAIVRELLAFGFSANTVADPTGMTPLHLAAAFNHLPLVRILLAHGASVFARAHSSAKVASELCSRQLPGFQACHAYLRCMEECLGVANSGKVYSTQSYRTTRCDELGLNCGDELVVIRKGDYNGSSWWWCCNQQSGQQGYVLQDLLALNKKSNTHHNNMSHNINSVA
jgi:ankyrin repeat protein